MSTPSLLDTWLAQEEEVLARSKVGLELMQAMRRGELPRL